MQPIDPAAKYSTITPTRNLELATYDPPLTQSIIMVNMVIMVNMIHLHFPSFIAPAVTHPFTPLHTPFLSAGPL